MYKATPDVVDHAVVHNVREGLANQRPLVLDDAALVQRHRVLVHIIPSTRMRVTQSSQAVRCRGPIFSPVQTPCLAALFRPPKDLMHRPCGGQKCVAWQRIDETENLTRPFPALQENPDVRL